MKDILEFLNEQSGLRLFGYGFLLIAITSIIFENLSSIFKSLIDVIKNRHKKNIKKENET